jgi:hypothetical protein
MANLKGDLSRLVVLHDVERWKDLKIVKEVEGFWTDEVASGAPLSVQRRLAGLAAKDAFLQCLRLLQFRMPKRERLLAPPFLSPSTMRPIIVLSTAPT